LGQNNLRKIDWGLKKRALREEKGVPWFCALMKVKWTQKTRGRFEWVTTLPYQGRGGSSKLEASRTSRRIDDGWQRQKSMGKKRGGTYGMRKTFCEGVADALKDKNMSECERRGKRKRGRGGEEALRGSLGDWGKVKRDSQ